MESFAVTHREKVGVKNAVPCTPLLHGAPQRRGQGLAR